MTPARTHRDEELRLAGVHRLGLLDTAPEERFDRLVELASLMLGTPIALITLIDRNRQWFKAKVGLDATETDREVAFCAHAIVGDDEQFVVPDASLDDRFADNPLVTGEPNVRFYAGHVLRDRDGLAMGTLCAIDRRPREFDAAQQQALALLAELVERELEREYQQLLLADLSMTDREKSLILDTLTEGLVLQDADGRIRRWNPAAERLLGLTAEQFGARGRTPEGWWLVRPDGTPWESSILPNITALATGQSVSDVQIGVHHPDGSVNWLRVSSHPVREHGEQPVSRVLSALTDITVEIEAETQRQSLVDELRRSERTARISLDSLEQGVILASAERQILRANPAAERILGESFQELSARSVSGEWLLTDEFGRHIAADDAPLRRSVRSGLPIIGERFGWTRPNGQRITIRLSCVPNVDEFGSVLLAFTDVTDELRAQRVLDATLDTAPVGLAVLDHERRIVRCNSTFAQHAGRSADELIGMDSVALLQPDERDTAEAAGRQLLVGDRQNGELEQHIVRPDGSEIWVETHLAMIPDRDRPLAIAATFDVTERRRMTLELSRFSYLFEYANDIITVVDASGDVLYTSPSSERVLGYPMGFSYPGGIFAIIHADDLAATGHELGALLDGSRGTEPFTARVRAYNGDWRFMECVGVNLLDEPAVRGIVITARDATERVHLTEQLAHRASHDALTDLPNRAALDDFLQGALARSERSGVGVGVCFVDLDAFKAVNDTHGHAAGDQLLVDVAREINRCLRRGDAAARVGGDEFVLVLDAMASSNQALNIASRVRDAITALGRGSDTMLRFGASVGLALSQPGDTVDAILKRADAALYRAKVSHDSSIVLDGEVTGQRL